MAERSSANQHGYAILQGFVIKDLNGEVCAVQPFFILDQDLLAPLMQLDIAVRPRPYPHIYPQTRANKRANRCKTFFLTTPQPF
jgi:hypothetical protein